MRDLTTISHKPFCDCFECLSPDTLLLQRESNHFDTQDLKILALKATSLATLNPDVYKYADASAKLKTALNRAKAEGKTTVVLKPEEKQAVNDVHEMEDRTKKIENGILSFVTPFKWVIIAVAVVVLIALFLRFRG